MRAGGGMADGPTRREDAIMMDIKGASALVTGGASGLGAATARLLAERGAKVVVIDLNEHLGRTIAAEIHGQFAKADVADEQQVQAAVDAASRMGPLRVLINCAGIGNAARTVDRNGNPFDLKAFEFVVRVNLIGSFNCLRLAAAAMSRTEPLADGARGAIVNTASVAAFDGQIGQAAYSASKGGVVGMTLPIARDLAAIGVRVNTIAPGLIDTPIYGEGPASEAFKENLGRSVLFPRRLGTSEEFASLALEVVTNSYINGETIRVDGGIRMPPK
jgi:NAD(P)-dependent dehydrogenase (short-subunit alcohol dehydrogenase family)